MTVQRLYQAATGVVDATGAVKIAFQPVASQEMWTGSISVSNAQGFETWQVQVGGAIWGTFVGSAQFGPIQAKTGEKVTVTAAGLTQGIAYNGALIGISSADGEVPPATPQPQLLNQAQIASFKRVFNGVGNSTVTILPAVPGHQYLLSTVWITTTAPGDYYIEPAGAAGTGPLYFEAGAVAGTSVLPFPHGILVPSLELVNATAPSTDGRCGVAYNLQ